MTQRRLVHITENIFKLREQDRVVGYYLYDEFDEVLSRIEGLLAEPETFISRYLVITLGGTLNIAGKQMILPVEVCRLVDMGKVKTSWRKESLMDAPTPLDIKKVTPAEEELILNYFDMEPYWAVKKVSGNDKGKTGPSSPESP